jgi:hypothetical protein
MNVVWEEIAFGNDGPPGRCRFVGEDDEGWHFRCVLDENHEGDYQRRAEEAA